jgi:hypothetical protein
MRRSTEDRFREKVREGENGCWLWIGYTDGKGYGRFNKQRAHRWSYAHFVGPIPDGQVLDHLCRVRHCVNPDHLRAVTNRENLLADGSLAAAKLLRDAPTCAQGHPWTEESAAWTNRKDGTKQKYCRICLVLRARARRAAERTTTCALGHPKVMRRDGQFYCPTCQRNPQRRSAAAHSAT